MATDNKKQKKEIVKTKPTIFPLGFAVGRVEDTAVVIDFIDVFNGHSTVIESMALPLEKARQLAITLMEVIDNEEAEN